MAVELKPHQALAVEKLSTGKILCGGVGSGKTITSLVYFYTKVCGGVIGNGGPKTPTNLYVITTAKKRDSLDWMKDAAKLSISTEGSASIGGITLVVDSWNNIAKYRDVKDAFFIFDEQRVVGSGAWTKHFDRITQDNDWILLSATPGDTWLDYIPVFVANGFYKNRTEFKRRHVVYTHYGKFPKVDRYLEVGRLVRLRNEILVKMPYEKHTTRHVEQVKVDYDKELFGKVVNERWHVYENRPLRDVSELFSVMRKVVNSDASRVEHLRYLMTRHPKLIVFYNFDYELEDLRRLSEGQTWRVEDPSSLTLTEQLKTSPSSLTSLSRLSARENLTPLRISRMPSESCKKCQNHCLVDAVALQQQRKISKSSSDSLSDSPVSRKKNCEQCRESSGDSRSKSTLSSSFQTSGLIEQSTNKEALSCGSIDTDQLSRTNGLALVPNHNRQEINADVKGVELGSDPQQSVTIAEWNGHKHQEIPQNKRWVYLVQYRAGAEGWNCTTTDAMLFYSLTYSYRDFHQGQGRIDRLDTPFKDLYYYVLASDSLIDKAILKALKTKKNFNESDFVKRI